MLKSIISLSAIIAVVYSMENSDYCNIDTCDGSPHTMCAHQSEDPAPSCGEVLGVGLTAEEQQRVLDLHNELRQKVANGEEERGLPGPQPPASNMQTLEWDPELAAIAQRWANQCNFNHDQCRDTQQDQIGQNLGYKGTTGDVNSIDVEDMVTSWYNEVENYNANSVPNFSGVGSRNGKQVGHYTQLVWANTNKLGCGAIKYPQGGFNRFYLVCNYGPTGNYREQPVYEIQ